MWLRSAMIQVLVMAQSQQAGRDKWRAVAEQLPPNALVTVRLTTGERVEGHVAQVTADALHLNPKTRIAVPVRVFAFDTIQSIDREKEGRSPGRKALTVLMWVGIGLAAYIAVGGLAVVAAR